MTLNRYAKRRDGNEWKLYELAGKLGATIVIAGPLDSWCGIRGKWYPVEVKELKGKYTPAQHLFLFRCENNRLPVWTWRVEDDVILSLTNAT